MDLHQVTAKSVQYLKEAQTSFLAIMYFKLILKTRVCTQNIWFLNQCFKYEVFPNYIKLKTNNNSQAAKVAQQHGMKKWMYQDRKLQYYKRDTFNIYLKVIHAELTWRLSNIEFDDFDKSTRLKIDEIVHNKYIKQSSKLERLLNKYNVSNRIHTKNNTNYSDHVFYNKFVNLTDVNFNDQEIQLLEKGFQYNLPVKDCNKTRQYLGAECEIVCNNSLDVTNKHIIANMLNTEKFEFFPGKFCNEYKISKQIKNKSKEHNIIFTRADKGKTVVAIKEQAYIEKTMDFLKPEVFKCINFDPTITFQKLIKDMLRDLSIFTDNEKFRLVSMNPQVPKLYSLIKLHKNNSPIRPVVSYITAPAFSLSNKLIEVLTKYCKFTPKYSIKNSKELISKIHPLTLPGNSRFISFDVQNLFPSIPPSDAIMLVQRLLDKNNVNPIVKQEILDMLTLCLDQNYFEFNDKIYISSKGLIMGNPLSPILSEIFMDNLEEQISNSHLFKNFFYWFRYVDDILTCFTGTDRQLKLFLDYINQLHNNITFTTEIEINKSINFLDLKISNKMNQHDFEIFHKPTYSDITIHANSNHPFTHKISAYNSFIHRLINTPLTEENFLKELNIIKQISINNGYRSELVDNILMKKQLKQAIGMVYPHKQSKKDKFHTLTYTGKLTNKIQYFFRKNHINIAFCTNNTLGRLIKNNKSKTKKENKTGVYELCCGTCNKTYIGQTGRSFYKRIKEHKQSYRLKNNISHYAKHLTDENHSFNEDFKILHIEKKGKLLNCLEQVEINQKKSLGLLLNDQLDGGGSPLLNLF